MVEEHVEEQWQPCRGEVVNLGEGLRRRRRAQNVQRMAAVTAGVAAFVLAGFFVFGTPRRSEPRFGGIGCHPVSVSLSCS